MIYVSTKKINDQIKFQQIRVIDAGSDRKSWRDRTEKNEFSWHNRVTNMLNEPIVIAWLTVDV